MITTSPEKSLIQATLGGLLLALLALVAYLPIWISALAAAAILWRLASTLMRLPEMARWLQVSLAAIVFLAVYMDLGRINGRESGIALLVAMLSLKLLETRGRRDLVVLLFLSYFLIASAFLVQQEIPLVIYHVVTLTVVTAVLIQTAQSAGNVPWRLAFRQTGLLLVQALPIMLILFVLFPRLSGPLWAVPALGHQGLTGLGDQMSPGSISELSLSDEVAFRIQFDDPPPAPEQRYWRGPVLWYFDGRTWSQGSEITASPVRLREASELISYRVTLEPHGRQWLLALDRPVRVEHLQTAWHDGQMIAENPIDGRTQYRATSALHYRLAPHYLAPDQRRRALQLPARGGERARALAQQWRQATGSPQAVVDHALAYFTHQAFFYTLQPPLLKDDPVDEFLFESRQGFCEHYASAFAFLMRAAGVPARVVLGYQGGDRNPIADYYIVRQADAHAWTEVWFEGRGWVRIDPTAAVSPSRISGGIAAAVPNSQSAPRLTITPRNWLRQARLAWDATNYYWNAWVLAYGPERQRHTLENLGLGCMSAGQIVLLMTALVLGAGTAVGLLLLWQNRSRTRRDPVQRHYDRLCACFARHGLPRRPHEGPRDYARRAAAGFPALAPSIRQAIRLYIELRYNRGDPARAAELRHIVNFLRRSARRTKGDREGTAMAEQSAPES